MEAELSNGGSEEMMAKSKKKQERKERDDWSNLKADVLKLIADRLIINITDYICFRGVCRAWRATNPRSRSHPPQLPWLVLGCEDDFNRLVFYSFSDARIHKIKLPTLGDMVVINGSCDGWLVLEDRPSSSISLLNPLTGAQIHLPSAPSQLRTIHDAAHDPTDASVAKEFTQALIWKISMSSNPLAADQDCIVIVISSWNRALLSIRFGHDDEWTSLDDTTTYLDVIYFKGGFYAIDYAAQVFMFDSQQLKKVAVTGPQPELTNTLWQFAELSGELVVLGNILCENPTVDEWEGTITFTTERIDILKLNLEGLASSLEETKSLDDHILFLGVTSRSISRSVAQYPCGKCNTIYVHDVYSWHGDELACCRSGVYDLESASLKPLPYDHDNSEIMLDCIINIWHEPCLF